MIALPNAPRLCAYADREAFWSNWGRNPALIYGCPSARWVNHPNGGALIRYDLMTPYWRRRYDDKAGTRSHKIGIMADIEPFVSPIDGSVIGGRAQKREHMERHDAIEAGDFVFDPNATAQPDPTTRELEEDIYLAKQKFEQGYWRDDPNRDDHETGMSFDDAWVDKKLLDTDREYRSGGLLRV